MANYSVWNVRLRHVWLQTPLKAPRLKRRARLRTGLQDALDRRNPPAPEEQQEEASKES